MRKKYVKPSVVVEVFKMEEAIAAGCGTIIDPDPETCGWFGPYKARSAADVPFNVDSCECTHTANDSPWFTSI